MWFERALRVTREHECSVRDIPRLNIYFMSQLAPPFLAQTPPAAVAPVVIPTPVVKTISLGGEVQVTWCQVGLFRARVVT